MADLNIACTVEGSYVPHSAAMLHSALEHSPGGARIHYMHGGDLSGRDRGLLAGMVERNGGAIEFIEVPDHMLESLPTEGFTGKATWYRIFLPELLPDLERVLFLDLDLIVTDSLAPLWGTRLDGAYVAAVTNVSPPHYVRALKERGLDTSTYFNAGVLLLDLDAMRRDGCSRAIYEYGVANSETLVVRDQDALNAVLGNRRLALDPRWNCMNSFYVYPLSREVFEPEALALAKASPGIRHFEGPGPNKPWHYLSDRRAQRLYAKHRSQTPWPRYRPEGRSAKSALKRLQQDALNVLKPGEGTLPGPRL